MFRWIESWIRDLLLGAGTERIVETPPPPTMAGRKVFSFRRVWGSFRFLVISVPLTPGAGNHRFDHVDVNASTGFMWGSSFDDASFPYVGTGWANPAPHDGHVQLVRTLANQARVYMAGGLGPAFAGVIQPPDGAILAVGVRAGEITVLSASGSLYNYRAITAADGTIAFTGPFLSSTALQNTSTSQIVNAAILDSGSIVFEVSSHGLKWFILGNIYSQSNDPSISDFLGDRYFGTQWYDRQGKWPQLLIAETHPNGVAGLGALQLYYFPGAGGNNSWRLLRYASQGASPANYYEFQDAGGVQWDAWPDDEGGAFQFPTAPPVRIVTTGGGKVRRLIVVPDLASMTYTVANKWTRDRAVTSVAWYTERSGPLRHVELLRDGTLRIVHIVH